MLRCLCTRKVTPTFFSRRKAQFILCNVYLLYKMAATPKIDLAFPALNGTLVGLRVTFSHNTM